MIRQHSKNNDQKQFILYLNKNTSNNNWIYLFNKDSAQYWLLMLVVKYWGVDPGSRGTASS